MKIVEIMLGQATSFLLAKDPGMFLYKLAKNHGWQAVFAYFSSENIEDASYQREVEIMKLGEELAEREQVRTAREYIDKIAKDTDVLMMFHYGSAVYKLAKAAKRKNPNIKVYLKLDMNENGFSHFYDGTVIRKIKSSIEIIKTRNVDCFTVENKKFYDRLSRMTIFRDRIKYLPNCVSTLNVNMSSLEEIRKENIIITVGRIGDRNKNTEFIIQGIEKLPENLLEQWKLYIVGERTKEFDRFLKEKIEKNPILKSVIVLIGAIKERQELYELYSKAKIFTLTSKSESFGIATIEAMYFGCYPIITRYGTIVTDITDNGRFGDIVSQGNIDDFTKILSCRMQDDGLIQKGKSSKEYARKNFSYEYWSERLDEYLTTI